MMLPKTHRMRRADFSDELFRAGQRVRSGPVALIFRESGARGNGKTSSPTRAGFVVAQKVAKTAVLRHTLKRRGRTIVQKYLPRIIPGKEAVFLFHSGSAELAFKQLEASLSGLLHKAGLLKTTNPKRPTSNMPK